MSRLQFELTRQATQPSLTPSPQPTQRERESVGVNPSLLTRQALISANNRAPNSPLNRNMSFLDKIGRALITETATANVIRDISTYGFFDDRFTEDPDFFVTDAMMDRYASDIPEYSRDRLRSAGSSNFLEFLNQVNDVRFNIQSRDQMLRGGGLETFGGMAAIMLGHAAELVPLTIGANFVLGPAGGLATLANRVKTVNSAYRMAMSGRSLASVAAKGTNLTLRQQGLKRGLQLAAFVDTPREAILFSSDKTLRPIDAIMAIGLSGTIGAGIGYAKPKWMLGDVGKTVQSAAEEMAREAVADGLARALPEASEAIKDVVKVNAKARRSAARRMNDAKVFRETELPKIVDELAKLSDDEIRAAARSAGVNLRKTVDNTSAFRSALAKELRKIDGMDAKQLRAYGRKTGAKVTPVQRAKISRDVENMPESTLRETYRREIGDPSLPGIRGRRAKVKKLKENLKERLIAKAEEEAAATTRKAVRDAARARLEKSVGRTTTVPRSMSDVRRTVTRRTQNKRLKDYLNARRIIDETEATEEMVKQQVMRNLEKATLNQLKRVAGLRKVLNRDELINPKTGKQFSKKKQKEILKERIAEWEQKNFSREEPFSGIDELRIDDDILNPLRASGEAAVDGAGVKRAIRRQKEKALRGKPNQKDPSGGPSERGVGPEVSVDDLAEGLTTARKTVDRKGVRESIARFINGQHKGEWGPSKWWSIITAPISARFQGSSVQELRDFGLLFFENMGLGPMNITTVVRHRHDAILYRMQSKLNEAVEMAAKEGRKLDPEEVVRTHRITPASELKDLPAPERLAIQGIREVYEDLAKYAKQYGVLPDELADNPQYFTRIYKQTEAAKYNKDDLVSYFERAILSHPNATKFGSNRVVTIEGKEISVARTAAQRIVDFMTDPIGKSSYKNTKGWIARNKESLMRDLGNDQEELIDQMLKMAGGEMHDPVVSSGRRRIAMNEGYVGEADMGQLSGVRISDFFQNDPSQIVSQYAQRLIGAIEIRKGLQVMAQKHPNTFGKLPGAADGSMSVDEVTAHLAKYADSNRTADFIEENVSMWWRATTGMPIYREAKGSTLRSVLFMQGLGQSTIGGYLGLAQLPEIGNVMIQNSLRSAMTQFDIGEMRKTLFLGLRRAKGLPGLGPVDRLGRALYTHTAVGIDYDNANHVIRRLDDMGFDGHLRQASKPERFVDWAREVSMLHPLAIIPMDTFLRRWGVKSTFQHFVDVAYKFDPDAGPVLQRSFWRDDVRRFGQLGIDETMAKRIAKELRRPEVVEVIETPLGIRAMDVNFEKIVDQGAYDALILGMRRKMDSLVQRQQFTDMPGWVSMNPVIRSLMQFRVFTLASKSKQLAAGIARGDATEAANMVASAGLGYLSYLGLTYARSFSVPPEEFDAWIAERTSFENTWKSAIVRSSYSSIFPMLIDTGAMAMGGAGIIPGKEPIFNKYIRTTEGNLNVLTGSVAWGIGQRFGSVLQGTLGNILSDKNDWSKQDLRDIQALIPLLKLPVLEQIISAGISNTNLIDRDGSTSR